MILKYLIEPDVPLEPDSPEEPVLPDVPRST